MTRRFEGQIALVTGASRGIGFHAALALAEAGAHVVALARTVGGLEELDDKIRASGGTASLVPMNMKDGDGLDRLGATLYERYGRLDMLLGNAGILGTVTPLGHLKPAVFDDVFAINVTGNFRLLRSMDPLLRAAPAGRALFLTSQYAEQAPAFLGPYSAAKAALETLVKSYADEHKNDSVRANLMDPGPVQTKLRARHFPGEVPDALPKPESIAPKILDLLARETEGSGKIWDVSRAAWRGVKD